MNEVNFSKWIPCSERLPEGDECVITCLVTCRERDFFNGKYGEKEVHILDYLTTIKDWNVKADIKVEAWLPLP